MPQVYTVSEIKDLEDGDIVKAFRGKVTRLLTWKDGVGRDNNGSIQILLMEDREGDEIKVKIWDHDRIPDKAKGQEYNFVAVRDKKNKLDGLIARDDEYKDKVTRILEVSGKAEMVKGGTSDPDDRGSDRDDGDRESDRHKDDDRPARREREDDRGERRRREDDPPREQEREPEPERESRQESKDGVDDTLDRLGQLENLYCLCFKAAAKIGQRCMDENPNLKDIAIDPKWFQALVGTLFISMDKQPFNDTHSYADDLPCDPVEDDDKRD